MESITTTPPPQRTTVTDTDDPRLAVARDLLAPYGSAISPADLAGLLTYKSTNQVIEMCRRREFVVIERSPGRFSIPTGTLVPWLASRLSLPAEEQR